MNVQEILEERGIQLSAHRVAIAQYVLATSDHPSAHRVWTEVQKHLPQVSRATIYNTLKLFVTKGLLKELLLEAGRVVFDANVDDHHHFIDEADGSIHDIPWDAVTVSRLDGLAELEVESYQVVARGRSR